MNQIDVQVQDQITIVSLNRSEKRNAMTPEMLDQLNDALQSLNDSTRAVMLVGSGKTFCAGFDLKLCAANPNGSIMRALLTGLSTAIQTMRSLPIPVVVGVHGAAVAGGCALLGGADIVVADSQTKLGYPVVKIGVSPAVSAAFMLASFHAGAVRNRLVDTSLMTGVEALKVGLVHELVNSPEDLKDRATELANLVASKPGIACKATKEWLNEISFPMTKNAQRGLDVSLSLTGQQEEQERLAALWG